MAARSVKITLNNSTDLTLHRTYVKLDHGEWCNNDLPPEEIKPHDTGKWCSESDGFATGTEGEVKYHIDTSGQAEIKWDNPFSGHNTYAPSAPKGYAFSSSGGSGDNAKVTFTLTAV